MRIVLTPKVHSFVLVRMDIWVTGKSVLVRQNSDDIELNAREIIADNIR